MDPLQESQEGQSGIFRLDAAHNEKLGPEPDQGLSRPVRLI